MNLIRKSDLALIALAVILFSTWLGLKTYNSSSDSDARDQRSGQHTVSQVSEPNSTTGSDTSSISANPSDTKNASTVPVQAKAIVETKAQADHAHNHNHLVAAAKGQPANKANKAGADHARPAITDPRALRRFGKGAPFALVDLPDGNLKSQISKLSPKAQGKAMDWLHRFNFSGLDAVESLNADINGGIYYNCYNGQCSHAGCPSGDTTHNHDTNAIKSAEEGPISSEAPIEPGVSAAAVPISAPPIYNSKPGSQYTIYLDFNGAVITGTQWNASYGRTSWTAKAYSSDADLTTFSDTDQAFIRRVWERIAEDYAPFDINVTTDVAFDPDTYTGDKNKVAWTLFCPRVDANGFNLPHAGSGGVAYVGVFGISNFASTYQPAFTKAETNDVARNASEAGAHEVGHNMGLSHDGTSTLAYYGGHAGTTAAPSWGPIMGTGYGRNVSQWSQGEYYQANMLQDDLSIISARVPYRADDHGNTNGTATVITLAGDSSFSKTGIIEQTNESDVFTFSTAAGSITINADPYKCDSGTWGGNLDINLELYNSSGTLLASNNPAADVKGTITTTVVAGTYFVHVKSSAAATPLVSGPSGYTIYGSIGQYTLSGTAILPGVGVIETAGTNVIEGGATDSYSLVLGTQPTSNVVVTITPDAQVTTNKASVTFTTSNWDTAQVVTVTAVNDTTSEGTHTGTITHSASSSDSNFNAISVASVIANITDNDSIEITAPNGGENWMAGSTQNITWSSLMGGNVKIELLKSGSLNSTIVASTANDGSYSWTISAGQIASIDYKIRITSVETPASSDTSSANFSVDPIPTSIYSQNFDASSSMPSGWSNTSSGATWNIVTSGSHSPSKAAKATGPTSVATATLTSASMAIPSGITDLELSFYHYMNLEDGWDCGVLEFSINGGAWFDVTSGGSGASFGSNGYNLGSVPTNYSNPLGGRAAWTGNFGGYAKTIVNLTDTAKYAGKSLKARWIIGTDNGTAVGSYWYVDTVELVGTDPTPTYTVTYNGNGNTGGTAPSEQIKTQSANLTLATNSGNLVKTGYAFSGWNTNASGTGTNYAAGATYSTDATLALYAKWTAVPTYTVTYNGNGNTGGTAPSEQIKTQGVNLILATNSGNLVKAGYTFAGWNTNTSGTGTNYAAGATYSTDATLALYAKWTIQTYAVTYNGNGSLAGSVPVDSNAYNYNDTATVLAVGDLAKYPYTFGSWNTAIDGSGTDYNAGDTFIITSDVTLFAKWDSGPLAIYEPFDDANSSLAGNTPGTGLSGTWSSTGSVTSGSLNFGTLPAGSGNKASIANQYGGVSVGNTLTSNGLLNNDSSLWFSVLVKTGGDIATNGDFGFAFGTESLRSGNNIPIANSGTALGFTFKNNQLRASYWAPTMTRSSTNSGNGAGPNTLYLVVGKITWGASSDTIEIYNVGTNMILGSPNSTYTTNIDQSLIDTISFGSKNASPAHEVDEIRVGSTYEAVVGLSNDGPGPVDHFVISAIGSPQTVGTLISGITITAQDVANDTATSFTGTVNFAGTAGITGTSGSFVDGILTGVSVTPTVVGSNLTLVVDDGSSHTGSATFTVLSKFQSWAGGGTTFSVDTNNDGISDGVAWLLGADQPATNAQGLLPVGNSDVGADLVMTFNCLNAANRGSAVLSVQYSQDLGVTDLWTNNTVVIPEVSGTVGGVVFVITANGNVNEVQATIPAAASSVFGRVLGNVGP